MQEADRGGTRLRLKRTRQGIAPWATFKFMFRERGMLWPRPCLTGKR